MSNQTLYFLALSVAPITQACAACLEERAYTVQVRSRLLIAANTVSMLT